MEAYDLGRFRHVVDVGGGDGSFLAQLLAARPGLNGTLFDQPHVVAQSLLSEPNRGLMKRCRLEGGRLFQSVPAGGDVYLLKWILQDWDDAAAIRILRTCRQAMSADSQRLIVEHLISLDDKISDATLMDLNMMVITGGRVRDPQTELPNYSRRRAFASQARLRRRHRFTSWWAFLPSSE